LKKAKKYVKNVLNIVRRREDGRVYAVGYDGRVYSFGE